MARAKNTSRSEARRRTREETRAELAVEPEDGAEATTTTTGTTDAPRRRGFFFKWPDIRGDIRDVPGMFRTRRLLWVPFILVAVGFGLALIYDEIPTDLRTYVGLYFQWFFNPLALFTYFIAGFVAPRASYIAGALVGLFTGVLILILIVLGATGAFGEVAISTSDLATIGVYVIVETVLLGMFAAGFAGWYRDFLRNMQTNSKQRQMQREAAAKAKRRDERQESRRTTKQRPAG